MKYDEGNVLAFSCPHIPYVHKDYLDFLIEIRDRCHCGQIICLGDLVDNHAISYHEHDPDLASPLDEMKQADAILGKWFKAFPKLILTKGNHDRMVDRKGRTVGLPSRVFKKFEQIWNLPKGWKVVEKVIINDVLYTHGNKLSGDLPHKKLAMMARMSAVMGHVHSTAGIEFIKNYLNSIYGMVVGCGIDDELLPFDYNKDDLHRPIVTCGVTTDRGKYPQIFQMK